MESNPEKLSDQDDERAEPSKTNVNGLVPPENCTLVLIKTANFAAVKHSKQRRKDSEKTPYINHPIGVAHILAEEGGINDLKVLQGALLHDTVEDTNTTIEEIEEIFGLDVRRIVEQVTDDKSLSYNDRKRLQIEHAPFLSREAKLVKLADKLYNLRDLFRSTPEGWSEDRVADYFVWAGKVIEGLLGTNLLLEDKLRQLLAKKDIILPMVQPPVIIHGSP